MNEPKPYKFIDDDDDVNLVNMVKEGVSYYHLTKLSDRIQLTLQEWADYLHISERTIQRYKKDNKSFDPIHAERIVAIELLYKKGIGIFEDENNFYTWMNTVNTALGGVKPKDLLDTSFGISMVYDELARIEHGILA